MHDLVIRGGLIVDGTGGEPFDGDVAVDGDRIVAMGTVSGRGRDEIDATDRIVTPGFVDVHTHYDGQVTWDPLLTPSIWHGVTTVVMGNCGVGFAPAPADRHEWLIGLMEGVEGIPGRSLREAIRWNWESVADYLDALDALPRALDVAAQIPHGAVRAYVMGERGAANEAPTSEDLARMAEIVRVGIEAGAVGFSTNRLPWHKAVDGREVPGTYADEDELFALGRAVRAGAPEGNVVFSTILPISMGVDPGSWTRELDWAVRLSRETQVPITFPLGQLDHLRDVEAANATGARIVPQVGCRRQGLLIGLRTRHAFEGRPSYEALRDLPVDERARRMRDPEVKSRILDESQGPGWNRLAELIFEQADAVFAPKHPHDHEPHPDDSVAAIAKREGRPVADVLYDLTITDSDGEASGQPLLVFILGGYPNGSLEPSLTLLPHPQTVLGLGDGGAHVDLICDASYPSYLLGYWVRDRVRGARLPLATAVKILTHEPAQLYSLHDRGVLAVGRKADVNVIDADRVGLRWPEIVHDLPAGAPRVLQRADGYDATMVSGVIVQRGGDDTGARPGSLVRS